jgi:hypothetical protein
VHIILRAGIGFSNDELMGWCEANRVEHVFGPARNRRVVAALIEQLAQAKTLCVNSGEPARVVHGVMYRTLLTAAAAHGASSARPSTRWRAPILDVVPIALAPAPRPGAAAQSFLQMVEQALNGLFLLKVTTVIGAVHIDGEGCGCAMRTKATGS